MKIQYYLLIGLVLFLMFSCQKSEVFNPKKKIQFVEKQNDSEIVLTDEFVYNLTGLELKERDDYNNEDIKAGMTFSIQYNKKTNKYTPCIKIPIELNRDSDIYE